MGRNRLKSCIDLTFRMSGPELLRCSGHRRAAALWPNGTSPAQVRNKKSRPFQDGFLMACEKTASRAPSSGQSRPKRTNTTRMIRIAPITPTPPWP